MENSFVILPDVTCDLSEELREKYDIRFVNGHIKMAGGDDMPSFLKWEGMTSKEFYKKLKENPNDFTTAPPNVEEWAAAFEKYAKEGKDILCMSISSKLSGTYQFMSLAAERIKQKYPEITIRCVDSMRFSSGFGIMAVYASILRSEGKNVNEVADYLEENRNRVHQAGWLDDLSFVAKKGRINHAKAFFGTLAGVKPIGEFDSNGLTTVIGKAKGEKQGFKFLIEYIKRTIENPEEQIIFIATSDRDKQAAIYKTLIEQEICPKKVYVNSVFPSSGINVGPGLMAAYYMGKPISKDLAEEKEMVSDILKNI